MIDFGPCVQDVRAEMSISVCDGSYSFAFVV